MNLDFGILWIEDSFNQNELENLRRRVRDAGFIARIEDMPNGEGIEDRAKQHLLYHRYDLILLDYKLKDELGNELAPTVRGLFPSTTILFYSGSYDEEALRRMIAAQSVEGVYCSARSRFIERTGALIEQTARALDRLSGMRGLSMRVVAECDDLMKTTMLSMCSRDSGCAERMEELDKDVLAFLDEMNTRYNAALTSDLQARIDTRAVDSAKLFAHFRRLTQIAANAPSKFGLSDDQVERLRELRRQSAQYIERVLNKRNTLGHVVEVESPNGWILKGRDDITVQDFPEIRQVFAGHIDAFREMGKIIVPLDEQ